jgi:hypothetical protein
MQQKQTKEQAPKQTRKEREDERAVLSKHQHPPVVTTFKTRSGVVVRF